jgi:hypothetical protein
VKFWSTPAIYVSKAVLNSVSELVVNDHDLKNIPFSYKSSPERIKSQNVAESGVEIFWI